MHESSSLISTSTLLMALLLLMVAGKIGAELAEWLKQPSVLGEILAGIIVGGTGLGLIARYTDGLSTTYRIFALTGSSAQATYQALDVFAEIGVILLLFEIGLHSDLYELRKVGASALWVGAAGVVLPFIGGWYVAQHVLGLPSFTALVIGAALTATSVGITARVFQDLGLLHTKESQVVLGAAVADDVIGLVILAVISALGQGNKAGGAGTQNLWLEGFKVTAIAVGFIVAALWIGVKCVPLLQRGLDRMRSRGAVTVIAMAFCLLMALLSQSAQLAPIIGAFCSGLILSHCNRKEEIQNVVRPLADIFIPLFFAMMGTVINLRVLLHGGSQLIVITLALVVVAVIGKVIGCMTVPDRSLNKLTIGLAMIPRGEVGLIYARLGVQHNWLNGVAYDGIVLTVMLTTLMTPPLLRLAALKFKNASQGTAPTSEPPPTSHHPREIWEAFDVHEMLQEVALAANETPPNGATSAAKQAHPQSLSDSAKEVITPTSI